MKYKIEHNLSDDEISDFAMLYRDHCEVRNQPFCMLYCRVCTGFEEFWSHFSEPGKFWNDMKIDNGIFEKLESFGTIWKLIMSFSRARKVLERYIN